MWVPQPNPETDENGRPKERGKKERFDPRVWKWPDTL